MSASQKSVLSREELYQLVWSTPMRQLSAKFGVSDVGLGKICKRHLVPKPPVGYWRQLEAGKAPAAPPLPACKNSGLLQVIIETKPLPPGRSSHAAQFPDIVAAIEAVEKLAEITVPASLTVPHPLVSETIRAFRKPGKTMHGVGEGFVSPDRQHDEPTLNVWCHPQRVDRALRIMDVLLKSVAKLGHEVVIGRSDRSPSTWIQMCGLDVVVHISETCTQSPHQLTAEEKAHRRRVPDYPVRTWMDYSPSGRLRLEAQCKGHWNWKGRWEDTPTLPLERKLDRVIIGMLHLVANRRNFNLRVEKGRQDDAARRHRELEEQQRRQEAREFFETLVKEMEDWEKSTRLRRYIAAIEDRARELYGEWPEDSSLGEWLARAKKLAARLDWVERSLSADENEA